MRYCHSSNSATSAWTRACLLIVGLSILASWPAAAQVARTLSPITAFRPDTPQEVQSGEATLVGHYNPNQMLRLVIGLQHPNIAEERQFLEGLQTVGKKEFHEFLSAEEWARRFAPSVADEQAVVDWATAQGLTVTHRYPNRLLVDVEAPAANIERAQCLTSTPVRRQGLF
jgi:subtilase family serine protease